MRWSSGHFHNTPGVVVRRVGQGLITRCSCTFLLCQRCHCCACLNLGESTVYPHCPLFPLFAGSDKSQGMLALSISPNRRYLAISETVQEKPVITIYELSSIPCRKRKVLNTFDFPVQKFISMAFSPDSKYLLTQTSTPESNLVYWLWEKQKVMAIIRTDTQNNPIYQVPPSVTGIMQLVE